MGDEKKFFPMARALLRFDRGRALLTRAGGSTYPARLQRVHMTASPTAAQANSLVSKEYIKPDHALLLKLQDEGPRRSVKACVAFSAAQIVDNEPYKLPLPLYSGSLLPVHGRRVGIRGRAAVSGALRIPRPMGRRVTPISRRSMPLRVSGESGR